MSGKVFLVGAGPGDPGLITVKGKACIELADVVVYDYLASPSLLTFARKDAELIYVGKKGGDHTLTQERINALIVEKANQGLIVSRLKGGDPFIFGRGGEEAEELINAGLVFEIVPGVTSAVAGPAYAGIPLTHRKYTSSVSIITGHEDPNKKNSDINWASIAKNTGTLVFLMGVKNLPHITSNLISHGKSPETPAALVRWGTTPKQVTVTGSLENIVERVKAAGLKAPCVIVIGDVIKLRETMKWFEMRPLFGKKIIITRAREQASNLVKMLSDFGAECIECPTIKIIPPADYAPLDKAIENLSFYDWIVFTSVNGVNYFFDRLFENGKDSRSLGHLRTAVIGPATKSRLLNFGVNADILPESYRAESVVAAFEKENMNGKNVLMPRAEKARPILPVEVTKMGALVDEIIAYRTMEDFDNSDALISILQQGEIDLVTFTSSSTVENFRALLPDDQFEDLMKNIQIASIGPITSQTAQNLGFKVNIIAETYTIHGVCDAILKFYNAHN